MGITVIIVALIGFIWLMIEIIRVKIATHKSIIEKIKSTKKIMPIHG
jgi:hypothetical protein